MAALREYYERKRQERIERRERGERAQRENLARQAAAEAAWAAQMHAMEDETRQTNAAFLGFDNTREVNGEPLPVYRWPPQSPTPLTFEQLAYTSDGAAFDYFHLRAPGLHWATPVIPAWTQRERVPGLSLLLGHTLFRSASLAVFVFAPNTFLPLLSERHLTAYPDTLRRQMGDEFQAQDLTQVTRPASLSANGNDVFQLDFLRLIPAEDPEQPPREIHVTDYLTMENGRLLIFRFQGSREAHDALRDEVQSFVDGMTPGQPLLESEE